MDYKRIYEPQGDVELMAIRALLDEHGIRYTVEGEYMRSTLGGVGIPDYSSRRILVWEEDFERASKVLDEFLAEKAKHRKPRSPGLLDKITMVLVTFIFLIFAPTSLKTFLARRRKRKQQQRQRQQSEEHENSKT